MKTKKSLLFIFILALLSCHTERHLAVDFRPILTNLPELQFPISFNSNARTELSAVQIENQTLKSIGLYGPAFFYGKLQYPSGLSSIVGYIADDVGTPFILTINKNGNLVDKHLLFETVIGDLGIYTSNHVLINSEAQIIFTDSTITRKLNESGDDEVPGTDSLVVKQKVFVIKKNGTIK